MGYTNTFGKHFRLMCTSLCMCMFFFASSFAQSAQQTKKPAVQQKTPANPSTQPSSKPVKPESDLSGNAQAQQSDSIFFRASWGPVTNGTAVAAQIAAIAPAALLVKDNRGQVHEVTSFRINYKFKSTYRDDESGTLKTMNDLRVSDFAGTAHLPDYWAASIKDNIRAGDEIIFNKILFRNPSGKLQMAPELRITVR
jgi:hypothetical protein